MCIWLTVGGGCNRKIDYLLGTVILPLSSLYLQAKVWASQASVPYLQRKIIPDNILLIYYSADVKIWTKQ